MNLNDADHSVLQNNVTSLGKWAEEWGMTFNASKCVHIKVGNDIPTFTLFLNGTEIPKSSSLKYLGITIQSNMKFDQHILNITKKANKNLGMLRRCLQGAPETTCLLAFNTIVRPILEYASPVWSPFTIGLVRNVDMIQRRAIRWVFSLKKLDSVTESMKEHDIKSLLERRKDLDLMFLKRIEFGCYNIRIKDYIHFNESYNTRGGTLNPHFYLNQFKHSFFNRMRGEVAVVGT